MTPDDFFPFSAENPFGRRIVECHLAFAVYRQNSIVRRFKDLAFEFSDLAEKATGFPADQFGPHKSDQFPRRVNKRNNIIINREIDQIMTGRKLLGFQLCQAACDFTFYPQHLRCKQQGPHTDHALIRPIFILHRQRKIRDLTKNGNRLVNGMAAAQHRFPDQIVFAEKHASTSC